MKHLLVDNEVIAKQKSEAALHRRYPNRDADQLALHQQDPKKYPHPSQCTKYLHGWRKAPNGRCEIDMEDGDDQFYDQGDQGRMTNVKQIEDDQGEDE